MDPPSPASWKRVVGVGLQVVAGVVVALLLAEAVLRLVDPGIVLADPMGRRVRLDPELLYRFLPDERVPINAEGFRELRAFDAPKGARRIVFLGDSFIMGWEGRYEDTLPRALEDSLGPGVEVYNLGVAGDGPDQALLRLRREGLALRPDLVIEGVFPGNDFADLVKNHLVALDGTGALQPTDENPVSRALPRWQLAGLARRVVRGSPIPPATALALTDALFRDAIVLLDGSVKSQRAFRAICRAEGLPCLDLEPLFLRVRDVQRLYSESGHLSPRGAHLAVRAPARSLGPAAAPGPDRAARPAAAPSGVGPSP